MKSANQRFAQKAIAVIIIVTLLYGAGVAPMVMLFISGVILIVFLITRRAQNREVERIFDFYVAAEAILRENRGWYGFEVAEVIEQGQDLLEDLPDPPPLHLFALGALHHRVNHYAAAESFLSTVVEDEYSDERYHTSPSPQLRRYVTLLRKIESEPSLAPQTLGAVRSLERLRRKTGHVMLAESRRSLEMDGTVDNAVVPQPGDGARVGQDCLIHPSISARQPIREVLNDIYPDDDTPAN